ncbi:MAG: flippase-like domain-containing protein [Deltaproteobacteria bacterium]|nr:flippase-like domain-containing protein [Deltaproteobacteria bacterium]
MTKFLIRVSVSFLIILYLSLKIDYKIFVQAFREIDILFYLLSAIIAISASIFKAGKFYLFIKNTSLSLPIYRLLAINFIARFYSLIIPTSLGPAMVRWYKVTENKKGRSFFLASTMVERLFFLLILLLFGTIPLFFYNDNQQIIMLRQRLVPLLAIAYILLSGALIYFLFSGPQELLKQLIRKFITIKKDSKFDIFLNNFSLKNSSLSLISALFVLSLLWQIFFLTRMFFLFSAMDLPFSIIDVTWMGSLVLLLQVLPISFAGIGVREGAYAYLFTLFGLPSEQGFLIGILFFSQMLIFAGIGAVLNLFEK